MSEYKLDWIRAFIFTALLASFTVLVATGKLHSEAFLGLLGTLTPSLLPFVKAPTTKTEEPGK